MTLKEFYGCTFIAFGPAFWMFLFTIARDPLRVIVLIASAFFWLLSLLLSSLLWYAIVPLREDLAFGLVFSVLFQEAWRYLFYLLIKKADEGLHKMTQQAGSGGIQLVNNRHLMAYVAGFGFGLISGAFSLVNVLADSSGPGTVGIRGDSRFFFVTSAFLTLCFILLHTFWGILFYDGLHRRKFVQPIAVVLSHMLVSCLTLLNQTSDPLYLASLIPSYAVLVAMGIWAYIIAGGSWRNFKAFVTFQRKPQEVASGE